MTAATQTPSVRIGRFHVLTDFTFQQRFSHAALAEQAIRGGADTIQFRQKTGIVRHRLHQLRETAAVCQAHSVPLIVNDSLDLALIVRAAGIHIGQNDIPVSDARRVLGPHAILGATATTAEQAVRAQDQGASYVGFGPVFGTRSKANPASVKGLDGLRRACEAVQIPVIAIAGITPDRVGSVFDAGAYGIAVMSGVTTAADPAEAARTYRSEISRAIRSPVQKV